MIDEKAALEYIKREKDVVGFFIDRIKGTNNYPIGETRFEEQLDDVFIVLLKSDKTPVSVRKDIIKGSIYFTQHIMSLTDFNSVMSKEMEEAVDRFCRFVNFTVPEELRVKIEQLMVYVLNNKVSKEVGIFIITAYLAFKQTEYQRQMWEELLGIDEYSMLALNGLVKLEYFSPVVFDYLAILSIRQVTTDWGGDVGFWIEHIADLRKQDIKLIVRMVLDIVKKSINEKDIENKLISKGWEKEWFSKEENIIKVNLDRFFDYIRKDSW